MDSRKYLLLLLLLLPLFSYSCKDEITTPNDDKPGRRDYVWTVDTISNGRPWNEYYKLWGTSPTNLWCVGSGGDFNKMILHYDGKTWKNFEYPGQAIEPWSIFGFSANEFWVGGGSGLLFKYSNGNFQQFGPNYRLDGYKDTYFMSFCGSAPTDIYTVGSAYKTSNNRLYAIIMHYDGNSWEYVVKPEIEMQFLDIKRGINDSPNYYLTSYNDVTDSSSIYEFDGKTMKRIYHNNKWVSMLTINNNIYFGFDNKIFKYQNNNFIQKMDFSSSNIKNISHFTGRNEKDLFYHANDGIGHYDGSDLKTIFKLDYNVGFSDAVIFEKDVYFVCPNLDKNIFIIVHGKLQ